MSILALVLIAYGAMVLVMSGLWLVQLNAFRKEEGNSGKVCKRGLWKYSRHPNYFFEWFHWWAYVAIGFAAPYGWLSLLGPAIMYIFLTKITGIPITEKALVKSRGDAYREYQRTTNALIPGPPKSETDGSDT